MCISFPPQRRHTSQTTKHSGKKPKSVLAHAAGAVNQSRINESRAAGCWFFWPQKTLSKHTHTLSRAHTHMGRQAHTNTHTAAAKMLSNVCWVTRAKRIFNLFGACCLPACDAMQCHLALKPPPFVYTWCLLLSTMVLHQYLSPATPSPPLGAISLPPPVCRKQGSHSLNHCSASFALSLIWLISSRAAWWFACTILWCKRRTLLSRLFQWFMRCSALWLFGFTCNAITDAGFALYSVPRQSLSRLCGIH